jgi:heterogeneous nuclear rnp K-like protein 2
VIKTSEDTADDPSAETTDKQGDTVVPDAPVSANGTAATNQILETKPVQSASATEDNHASSHPPHHESRDETGWLHVRAIISSAEAATVIGKGGENVSQIRRMAGAKCTVSEYSRGAVERILTVSGLVDAVAKVCEFTYSRILPLN